VQSGCEIPLHFFHLYQQPQRVWHDYCYIDKHKPNTINMVKTETLKKAIKSIDELIALEKKKIEIMELQKKGLEQMLKQFSNSIV
jgi:hypothetical protein